MAQLEDSAAQYIALEVIMTNIQRIFKELDPKTAVQNWDDPDSMLKQFGIETLTEENGEVIADLIDAARVVIEVEFNGR